LLARAALDFEGTAYGMDAIAHFSLTKENTGSTEKCGIFAEKTNGCVLRGEKEGLQTSRAYTR